MSVVDAWEEELGDRAVFDRQERAILDQTSRPVDRFVSVGSGADLTAPQLLDAYRAVETRLVYLPDHVERELGITIARYWQLLERHLGTREALEHDPELAGRLRRALDARDDARRRRDRIISTSTIRGVRI